MSQIERFQPLAFAAAQAALKDAQIENSARAFRGADLVALGGADPHVVTRGSGISPLAEKAHPKKPRKPYKPGGSANG